MGAIDPNGMGVLLNRGVDLDRLEAIARAANGRPAKGRDLGECWKGADALENILNYGGLHPSVQDHIAMFDPTMVLALIALARRAK